MESRQTSHLPLSEEEVAIVVQATYPRLDYRVSEYSIKPVSDTPTGFLGEHLRMTALVIPTIAREPRETARILSYFIKKLPSVPQHLEYALRTRAFYKEIELYKTVFVDLKRAAGEDRTKWCPDHYYSRGEELLVVEDLTPLGYYMLPERGLMDEEHVKASLKAMAAMHAASIVFEEKLRRGTAGTTSARCCASGSQDILLGEIYEHLTFETEASDVVGHPGNTFYRVGINSQTCIVDLLVGYSESERREIKGKLPEVLEQMLLLVRPSDEYRNVFVHGDLWANNILFRKGSDGRVVHAVLIDFQLARYAPPAHDVMMFLHLVQTRSFRSRKQREMLWFYYDALATELTAGGSAPEEVLPKGVFLESCKRFQTLGIISAVLYFQLILVPPVTAGKFMTSPDLYQQIFFADRSDMIKECFEKDEIFRTRMTEAMTELVEDVMGLSPRC